MPLDLTSADFEKTVEKEGIVVLDFWAAWCGPCRAFAPIFAKAAEENPDITWGKIDTDKEREIAGALQIRSIPTLMIFRDGILIFREAGAMPAPVLKEIVDKVRALDMADVKKQIAEHEAAHARGECNHDHGHDHDHHH